MPAGISGKTRTPLLLALGQLVLAILLTASNSLRPDTMESPAWVAPDVQFRDALSAPVAVTREGILSLTQWLFPAISLEWAIHIVGFPLLVAIFWYGVGVELQGQGRSRLTPKTHLRPLADGLAVLLGIAVAIVGVLVSGQFGGRTVYAYLVATPYFLWSVLICGFYGNDLWMVFHQWLARRAPPPRSRS